MQQSDITYIEKINELRLDLSHPNSKDHIFIFVEGDSDVRIFRNLFNDTICNVERIPGGNPKLTQCLIDLSDKSTLLMSIRDADFLILLGNPPESTDIHLTDYHDIEITIFSIEEIESSILNEFTNLAKGDYGTLINRIYETLKPISVVKLLNFKFGLGMKFKFGFLNLIKEDGNIDIEQFIQIAIQSAGENCNTTVEEVLELYQTAVSENYNEKHLTNGHDFVKLLAEILGKEHGHTGLQERTIESSLRVAFTLENFKKTNLYNQVVNWGNEKGVEEILS